jgi:hypothetical protein
MREWVAAHSGEDRVFGAELQDPVSAELRGNAPPGEAGASPETETDAETPADETE